MGDDDDDDDDVDVVVIVVDDEEEECDDEVKRCRMATQVSSHDVSIASVSSEEGVGGV